METLILIVALVLLCCLILPIIAIARTARIRNLEARLAGVEAALLRLMQQSPPAPAAPPVPAVAPPAPEVPEAPRSPAPPPVPESVPAANIESVIGQKWIGWIAVVLIFCAVGFFLKYAFENRWIGELGRVTLGIVVGLVFAWGGLNRYRKGWRYLSQVLTGGGITILYLSIYGASVYYHLIGTDAAFAFLVLIVAEAALLALVYDARPIAVMALAGGFLVPILLSTGRDQYRVLFTYIGLLDTGMLAVVMARRWRWIGLLAYAGTQSLFWAWYSAHYHPEKRPGVLVFQAVVFLLFAVADLAPHLRGSAPAWEEYLRLVVNPFVFYATCYALLNDEHHNWMAALALLMAMAYAALARIELALRRPVRRMLLVTVGTALTFVTLAIPVQLESNWITIAWSLEALALLWVGVKTASPELRCFSAAVFLFVLVRFLFEDTPWGDREAFTPIFNRYFLGMLVAVASLAAAAHLLRRLGASGSRVVLPVALLAAGVFWLGSSVEAYSYFGGMAERAIQGDRPETYETSKQLRWAGQLTLSVLWSIFAGLMTAAGFRKQVRAWRVAGLVLFGITLGKVGLLDIAELREFYRILALLALGLVLLGVAWKYQRSLRRDTE